MSFLISNFQFPVFLQDAYELSQSDGKILFAGGTYILTVRQSENSIIDINNLLDSSIDVTYEQVRIGAGATLQHFVDCAMKVNPNCKLIPSIEFSCPSKNIRNQRTFGGEIAQNRPNSEILTFLNAVDAQLTIVAKDEFQTSIRDWDCNGIITEISYYPEKIDTIAIQRFSVILFSPAIVTVAGILKKGTLEFAIGGKTDKVTNQQIALENWEEDSAKKMANRTKVGFYDDEFGSISYKESLIKTAVQRVKDELIWKSGLL